MSNADLNVGDIVQLSPDTEWELGIPHNPLNTDGVVEEIGEYTVDVIWDNGTWNDYRLEDDDLILIRSVEEDQK